MTTSRTREEGVIGGDSFYCQGIKGHPMPRDKGGGMDHPTAQRDRFLTCCNVRWERDIDQGERGVVGIEKTAGYDKQTAQAERGAERGERRPV